MTPLNSKDFPWQNARPGTAGRRLAAALAAAALIISCRKAERPTPQTTPAPAPAATPAAGSPGAAPSIGETPEAGRPPFSGLRDARGMAVDGRGRIWVADYGNSAIRVFDAQGGYLGGWGSRGDGRYQLKDPCAVALRGEDVYVADTWNARVQRFSLSGTWEAKAPIDFYGPRGIAVAPDGKVWVADTGNQRVVSLERDLSNPKFFGKPGSGAEQFSSPVGIAAGPSGRIYVADTGNRRVQVLDSEGRFRTRFPFSGWGPNSEPFLQTDPQENLYASDPGASVVVKLDRNGKELRRWTADDTGKKLAKPTGLALDEKSGTLYVVNAGNGTVVTLKIAAK